MSSGDLHVSLQPGGDTYGHCAGCPCAPALALAALQPAPGQRTSARFCSITGHVAPGGYGAPALALHRGSSCRPKNTEDIVPSRCPGGLVSSAVGGLLGKSRPWVQGLSPIAWLRSCHQCNPPHQTTTKQTPPIKERIGARAKGPWFLRPWSIAGTGKHSVLPEREISPVALTRRVNPPFD
jgi:hypothetical protein